MKVKKNLLKRIVTLCVLLMVLLSVTLPLPVAAQVSAQDEMSIMWTYITTISPSLSFSGKTATYNGSCTGRTTATYSVVVYLMKSDGTVAAGPCNNGPNSSGASAGAAVSVPSGTYFTRVYARAWVNNAIVESPVADSTYKTV